MGEKSVLDNVVFLDIETTGLDPLHFEIIEIGAIKIKDGNIEKFSKLVKPKKEVPISILHLCKNLKLEDFHNAEDLAQVKKELLLFIEDLPLVCHNGGFEKSYFNIHIPEIRNEILDSMELAAILEPGRKSFNLNDLMQEITTLNKVENHRGLDDSIDTMYVVNTLMCRHFQREETVDVKETLFNRINKLANGKKIWNWTKYLVRPIMFTFEDYPYVLFKDKKSNNLKIKALNINYEKFEVLLRDEVIWNNGGNLNYQYRRDQEKLSLKIRENYEKNRRIFIEAPTGSGKTFAYLLIASTVTYLNKINKKYDDSNFIISTDTKELQNQLIDKDIPNILSKLGLKNKIRYGAIKGKGNYLCFDRLSKCKEFEESNNGLLAYIFFIRLGENGLYGDLENINYWAQNHFQFEKYKSEINCDSENCNLDKCIKPCFLRKRYDELPQDNITVVNHSLLASWPYAEKRKINHLILDEAHNLMEKAYDFFAEEFVSVEFLELLKEVDTKRPSMVFLLNRLNALNNYREQIDRGVIVQKAQDIEFNIINMLNEFKRLNLNNSDYNLVDEYFICEIKHKDMMKGLEELLSELKRSIYALYKIFDTYIRNITSDEEKDNSNEYRTLINYTAKLKSFFDIIDNFMEFSKDYSKVLEIHKDYLYFVIKNVPLNIGQMINDNILKEVKSTTFLSATLRINNSFFNAKKLLGQEKADEFSIPSVFNLKSKTKIFAVSNMGSYKDGDTYIKNVARFIFNTAEQLNGHILILFSNNLRREAVHKELEQLINGTTFEVFTSKKAIPFLQDKERKIIILGSKGFFEGIDVPGDWLNCVMIDKIPNINPSDPLFKALKEYRNFNYSQYNYPKVCIRMKQGYGRLIRSIFDYGYFMILDAGTNPITIRTLEKDLEGPIIEEKRSNEILNIINYDYTKWKKENLHKFIIEYENSNEIEDFNNIPKKSNSFWQLNNEKSKDNKFVFNNKNIEVIYYKK